jgi:2-oxoglutarate dehydrogenase E2 component (dihydrolipoamide succinyltransferase)
LKAEEVMAVVGAVVCLIDTEGAKPEGSDKSEGSTAEVAHRALLLKRKAAAPAPTPGYSGCNICFRDTSSCKKKF